MCDATAAAFIALTQRLEVAVASGEMTPEYAEQFFDDVMSLTNIGSLTKDYLTNPAGE